MDTLANLNRDDKNAHATSSPYGYQDAVEELHTVKDYHQEVLDPDFLNARSEAPVLYDHVVKKIHHLLEKDRNIKGLLNFGVSYAHVDSLLAKLHPEIHFAGIDRSIFTKLYNEEYFPKQRIEFVAGDIFEYVRNSKNKFKNGALLHMRTLLLLPPGFILRLYREMRNAGFEYIVGMEQVGISRSTCAEYIFSDEPRPSVSFRDGMYIHNYPGLLKESGFQVIDADLIKTAHPHEDFRIFSFIARRN